VVERVVAAARRRSGQIGRVVVRQADPRRWNDEVRTLFKLYNAAFDSLWGFVPMTWEEFSGKATEFRPFYRPELVLIAEVDGEAVGFGLVLPDINAALHGIRGRLLPFGWLHLLRSVPRIDTARFMLTGVLPAHKGKGVAALIAHEMMAAGRRGGIRACELSLVQQANAPMRHIIETLGCPRVRTFRLYERSLDS
jgi:GNAT superfamily N-acetyltransferase